MNKLLKEIWEQKGMVFLTILCIVIIFMFISRLNNSLSALDMKSLGKEIGTAMNEFQEGLNSAK